jgi:hypothetical protein
MKKKILIGALIAVSLAAVAMVATKPGWLTSLVFGEERVVRKRVEGYWTARLAGDLKAMAPYIHPLQKAVQENDLLETRSYEIGDIQIKGDQAMVAVKAKYRVKLARTSSAERELAQEDHWVRYKGQWYHALHPVGFGELLEQGLGRWRPKTDEVLAPPPSPPNPAAPPADAPASSSANPPAPAQEEAH